MSSELTIQEQEIKQAREKSYPFFKFSPTLEQEFKQFRHKRLLSRVPFIGVSGILLFTLFAVLDIFILPETAYIITTCIRLFLICPLIAVAILASKQNWPVEIFSWYYLGAYIVAGLGIVAIIYTARINDFSLPYDGVLLHLVFGYFLMGMPYKLATLGGMTVTIAYLTIELTLNTAHDQLASNLLFILTLNAMGFMGSYMQDRSRRHLFLNKKRIELALKKDEEEIEAKTKLVATASHDLRQPLHAMNILVEALENEHQADEGKNLTQKLRESLRQLNQLLTSLLDISRFNAKIVEYNPQNVELSSLIEVMLHNQNIRAQELDIEIVKEGASPCIVNTDPVLLERVFRNLCENIYQHAHASQIKITWKKYNNCIRLSLIDNGKGIKKQEQEKIFEEFHKTADSSNSGMGLGLSIVKQSCEIMGCSLGLESLPEQGATFWIDLKPAYELPFSEIPKPSDKSVISGTQILVVSSNHDLLDTYADLLGKWGYNTSIKASPEGALNFLKENTCQLIFSDIHFPGTKMNGIDLVNTARAQYDACIPAILITEDESMELKTEIARTLVDESNITEIAFKPVSAGKLKLMLKHFCANTN